MRMNSPKVVSVVGSAKRDKIGRLNVLMTASHIDTTNAAINPLTNTPGNRYAVISTAILLMSKFTNRFCMSIISWLNEKYHKVGFYINT